MNDICKNLKKAREEAGLTEERLAEKMGVSRATISNCENGRTQNISHQTLMGYMDHCHITPNFIFFGEEISDFEMYKKFQKLSPKKKKIANRLIDDLSEL